MSAENSLLKISLPLPHFLGQSFIFLCLCFTLIFPQTLSAALSSGDKKKQAEAYFQSGTAKYLEGNINQALKDLEKVIELDPQHEQARSLLSVILGETASSYYIQGDFARALPLLEKLKRIFPEDAEINRMYEQASKSAGVIKRSEDVMKFLQKQQQQLLKTKPPKPPPPPEESIKKIPLTPQKKSLPSLPESGATPSLDIEVNRRVSQIQEEIEKKHKKILEEIQNQLKKEKKEFLRKVLMVTGTFSGLLALLFAFLAFYVKKQTKAKIPQMRPALTEQEQSTLIEKPLTEFEKSPQLVKGHIDEAEIESSPEISPIPTTPIKSTSEVLYQNLSLKIEEIFNLLQNWDTQFSKLALEFTKELLSGMKTQKEELFKKSMSPYEDLSKSFFNHCVNVAILATTFKMEEESEPSFESLQQLALAAALHDVGISGKLKQISEKKSFDQQEKEILHLHRKSSAWILKNLEAENSLYQKASNILLASHDLMVLTDFQELQKGEGKKLPADTAHDPFILEMAALISFMEVLEALTHWRPHREAYSIPEAMEILRKNTVKNTLLQKIYQRVHKKLLPSEAKAVKV